MQDEFQKQYRWITGLLKRPISDFFKVDSLEYAILIRIKNEWGKRDTTELLTELKTKYGNTALWAVDKFLELNITRDWVEVGKKEAHEGTEIEDFIRILWEPLKEQGFEFTIKREGKTATFCVTKCPIYELAKEIGMHEWLYHLACLTDFYSTPAFSSKIGFSRTKTLIQGDGCCNHRYYYKRENKAQ